MTTEADSKQRLLKAVKKEVKQIMEEAVTRKFVHQESSSIISLCGAVESCLLHGLKKRALGLFKLSTTTALLQKIAKHCPSAAHITALLTEVETKNDANRKSIDSNKNVSRDKKMIPKYNPKYLWIRLSIFEKQLAKILDYLVQNSSKYYDADALIADAVDGPIVASLLVGPCALDYSKMKTPDHWWTDPPADELVQRHRIHSTHSTAHITGPGSPKRPGLQIRRHTSSSSEESSKGIHMSAKEYVESLHQNSRNTLLYGKNNVMVQPKEDMESLPGYLSLHQSLDGLTIKWTPNQLMNGCYEQEEEEVDRSRIRPAYRRFYQPNGISLVRYDKPSDYYRDSLYWDFAQTVFVDEVVYIHCHQQPDCGGTIVLVSQDGVQRPPIHFPKGGHLLAFLSCLENGLSPHGQLDPPLWSQKGKGKVFPKIRRKASRLMNEGSTGSSSTEEDEADYVFRIIQTFKPENMPPQILDPKAEGNADFVWPAREHKSRSYTSSVAASTMKTYAKVQEEQNNTCISKIAGAHRTTLRQLCDTMKKQIISRAFYGWLAHCRHLKTVRTHLSGLVHHKIISCVEPDDVSMGLTEELWRELTSVGVVTEDDKIYRLVYYGGVAHEIRREVWPYLLGHYSFNSTEDDRSAIDAAVRTAYEQTMSEWLAVEAIVRQRDKEIMAANLERRSQESQDAGGGHIPLMRKDSSLSNDVFVSQSFDDSESGFSHPETLLEESSTAMNTPELRNSVDIAASMTDQTTQTETDTEDAIEGEISPTVIVEHVLASKIVSPAHSPDDGLGDSIARQNSLTERSKLSSLGDSEATDAGIHSESLTTQPSETDGADGNIIVTKSSIDSVGVEDFVGTESADTVSVESPMESPTKKTLAERRGSVEHELLLVEGGTSSVHTEKSAAEPTKHDCATRLSASRESLISPSSPASNGGVYAAEMVESVALNLHRIDKDVQRCDRNYWYFSPPNLDKLRNIMCTYVWEHLEVGYVQGMCDLVAPLLVILDDEALTYSCFCELMKRMSINFPHGGAMDTHFANMRSLIQILDSELFELMHQNGDYTHFYFCYRWFLLDFKRELMYEDVFSVWETIWSARYVSSPHFVLFIALALVQVYRDIILDNNMDFTDIIKFFNEMAERHNAKQVLKIGRDLVFQIQTLIDNK